MGTVAAADLAVGHSTYSTYYGTLPLGTALTRLYNSLCHLAVGLSAEEREHEERREGGGTEAQPAAQPAAANRARREQRGRVEQEDA